MERSEQYKINYIIYSPFPEYVSYIGGATVPHTLAKLLTKEGENVYLYANSTKKDYNVTCIPWGTSLEFDAENTIVIFIAGAGEHTWDFNIPDVLKNAPNIVRWLVNDQVKLYPVEDKFYTFHKYWDVLEEQRIDGELSVIEVDHSLFYNYNKKRQGSCYLIKGNLDTEEERAVHNLSDFCIDSVFYNIPDDQKMQFLAKLFNEKEYFISYTPFTFMSVLAAMCGCKSIIIPKQQYGGKPFDKEKWKNEIWCAKTGLGIGFEELPDVIETLQNVIPSVKHYEEVTQTNQIRTFITDSYEWLTVKYNL
jgi:hypothetical protein